ncbi:MAG: GTPase HflX [Betaproteobacteria bacterium]|nr:GTPase HflX [Betaproteobacteria bacterium]
MFERPERGAAVVLAALDFGEADYADSLDELKLLADSAGLKVAAVVEGRRGKPDAALFAGSGKADEIGDAARAADASLVIFNHELSPIQERNLERRLQCRVLDRTALILDIFAQRARSNEGKLQVELAQLRHYATRLVRGWTHLERQKGGIGMRGGPGETQLELDRRLIAQRIKTIESRLDKLARTRLLQRRSRQRGGVLQVSLVGYTNAGKSTLFNTLTKAGAYAADQLFATLDTTSRRVWVPEAEGYDPHAHSRSLPPEGAHCPPWGGPAAGREVVLSDTVGFITRLPHSLVAAFHATLEETAHADLLLHVVDSASANRDRQMLEVEKVLKEIGAEQVPQIRVMNKVDLTGAEPQLARDEYGKIAAVWLSARTGAGTDLLRSALGEFANSTRHDRARPLRDLSDTDAEIHAPD